MPAMAITLEIPTREPCMKNLKPLLTMAAVAIVAIAVVSRVSALRNLVFGTPAS
jgi:hypothetical protein